MQHRIGPDERSTGDLTGRLCDLSAALADVTGTMQPWRLSDRDLVEALDTAYRVATQAHAAALVLLAETDSRHLPEDAGAASTQAWLTHRRRLRPADCKRNLTLARLIGRRVWDGTGDPGEGDLLGQALVRGQVNIDQAGVVAHALTELPADATVSTRVLAEKLLIDETAHQGPAALTRLGHAILERVDPDAADRKLSELLQREERLATQNRSATRYTDGHGSVWYKLRIPIGDDAYVWPVLDTLAAPEPATDGTLDTRSPSQRLADAFVEAFRRLQLTADLPTAGGDRPRVLITLTLDQLRTGNGAATLVDTGDQLSVAAARRLACDAQIIPAVLAGRHQLLDLGRARRTVDGPLRLAVIARDRGCVHPGCTRPPRWCDVHHVVAWWKGGRTSLDNSILVCGHHHRLYDQGHWRIRFAPDGIPETIPPDWIDPARRPRRHERHHQTDRI